jgi:arylsulfatase A-like enzyme
MNIAKSVQTCSRWIVAIVLTLIGFSWRSAQAADASHPNIVLVLLDNVGWGEFGCYGGGELRGAPTPNIDHLAAEGLRLTNFNVESSCTPTRSALMTGRFAVRSGTLRSESSGLVAWEVTLPELLKKQGYATAHYGKWHLGDAEGRYPTNFGFDEWYGIPRSSGESLNELSPGYDPKVTPPEYIMQGTAGKPTTKVKAYDLAARRAIDLDLVDKAVAFAARESSEKKPFFEYVPLTQVHYPTIPSAAFAGKTGFGDFADSMVQTDYLVGKLVRAVEDMGIAKNTIIVLASDNGAEYRRPWRGTAGPWSGNYHTMMEGGIRAPAIVRWTGVVKPSVSDGMVHAVDLFTTLAHLGGAKTPSDRPIDGVDQMKFFTGETARSARDGFPIYVEGQLYGAKWHDWKYHIVWQPDPEKPSEKPAQPYLFNLTVDPKEESPRGSIGNVSRFADDWAVQPILKSIKDMNLSLTANPPIPFNAPVNYVPKPGVLPAPSQASHSPG